MKAACTGEKKWNFAETNDSKERKESIVEETFWQSALKDRKRGKKKGKSRKRERERKSEQFYVRKIIS